MIKPSTAPLTPPEHLARIQNWAGVRLRDPASVEHFLHVMSVTLIFCDLHNHLR